MFSGVNTLDYRIEKSPVIVMNAPSDASVVLPGYANDNNKVKSDWMTPPEALQLIRRIKQKLQMENIESQALFYSAPRRRLWDEIHACEQCLLWKYFRN